MAPHNHVGTCRKHRDAPGWTRPGCEQRGGPACPAVPAEPHPDLVWSWCHPPRQGPNPSCDRGEAAAAGKGCRGDLAAWEKEVWLASETSWRECEQLFLCSSRLAAGPSASSGLDGGSTRVPNSECCGKRPERPGAPGARGGSRGVAQGSSRSSVRAGTPLSAREQRGQREPSPVPAPPPAPSPRRPGPTVAVAGPKGRRGLGGCLLPTPGLPAARAVPGLGAPPGSALLVRAPVQKWEVGGGGDFPSLCILKDWRHFPVVPTFPSRYQAGPPRPPAKTWKTTIPLRSAAPGGSARSARPAGLRPHGRVKAHTPSLAFAPHGSCSPSPSRACGSGLPRALPCSHRRPSLLQCRVPTPLRTADAVATGGLRGHLFPWSGPPRPGQQLGGARPGGAHGRRSHPPTRARGAPAPSPAAAWRSRALLHTRTLTLGTLARAAWAADRRSSPAPPVRLRHGKPRLRLLALRSRGGLRSRRDSRHR